MSHILSDFKGRELTAISIGVAAVGSAALNIWGASQMFPNKYTATIFAIVITAGEFIAFLSLRHIVSDYANYRYWKARLGSLTFMIAVVGCVISGHHAFSVLKVDAEANYKALDLRATARQAEADTYHADWLAGKLEENDSTAKARWEMRQDTADKAKREALKAKPPHQMLVYVFLALFELLKIGGLYALATPSTRGQTWKQRKAQKRREKVELKNAEAAHKAKLAAATAPPNVEHLNFGAR